MKRSVTVASACVAASAVLSGCGIRPDAAPRDLPANERLVTDDATPGGSDAAGGNRIYLVDPGEDRLLRSVPREAATGAELIEVLLAGPNDDELAAQYSSVIPAGTKLLSARSQGQVLTIDLSSEITEITGQNLAQAVAQIVYTASELDGIEAVQLRVENEELTWPTASPGSTSATLRIYDYPNAIVTTQPDYPALPVTPTAATS